MEPDYTLILGYAFAVTLLTITPGIDTALILQSSISKKKNAAKFAAIGILLGCAAWGILVAIGLGAIITSSDMLYALLKSLGAIYLIWIGISTLLNVQKKPSELMVKEHTSHDFIKRGFMANILNPKVGLFYIALLPQFIPQNANVALYSLMLVFVHIFLSAVWFWMMVSFIGRAKASVAGQKLSTIVEIFTGILFIGFGVKLLISTR